jgi:hypothetical protein
MRVDENSCPVDADGPLVQVVNLLLELVRIEVELGLLLGELVVEGLSPQQERKNQPRCQYTGRQEVDGTASPLTVFKNLIISLDSLLTMVLCLVSQITGTVSSPARRLA